MANRQTEPYANTDLSGTPGLNLMQYIGGSKMLTGGFGAFGVKAMLVSNVSATVFGLGSYMLLGDQLGPACALLVGSCVGFVGGCIHRWRTDRNLALVVHDMYPDILRLHLMMVDPAMFRKMDYAEWSKDLKWNIRKQGFAIAAMYSAGENLDRIFQEKNDRVTQQYVDNIDEVFADQ